MRSFLLAATVGAAESLAVDVHHKSKKPAVQALMESAASMLKNGATPAAIDFANETLTEVRDIVMPAIIEESVNDQAFIYSLHSQFQVVRDTLAENNGEVRQLNVEEQALSSAHQTCRDTEAIKCTNKRECEMELYRLWTEWVVKEEELQAIHARIDGHFCPEGTNGTTEVFRLTSTEYMTEYMNKKEEVDDCELHYDAHFPSCVAAHTALDSQSATCNELQRQLEEKACQHEIKITEVLATYRNEHAQAAATYDRAVEEVMQLENDRKREWTTLRVVQCLLERIREQNGVACNSTGQVTEEVGVCERKHAISPCTVTSRSPFAVSPGEGGDRRLCLDYPAVPPDPAPCPARDRVEGVCRPVVQPVPCDRHWRAQEVDVLPAVPLPPFNEQNPGCNAYPECTACDPDAIPETPPSSTCPAYTVDGCERDGEEGEHPLTHHTSCEHVADVRCCSIDGRTCQSRGFANGTTYTTPSGGTHLGCYFSVSYQEALSVCHNAGMRLCSTTEMESCCNTGCWHNHHAIWVDVVPGDRQD